MTVAPSSTYLLPSSRQVFSVVVMADDDNDAAAHCFCSLLLPTASATVASLLHVISLSLNISWPEEERNGRDVLDLKFLPFFSVSDCRTHTYQVSLPSSHPLPAIWLAENNGGLNFQHPNRPCAALLNYPVALFTRFNSEFTLQWYSLGLVQQSLLYDLYACRCQPFTS